VSGGSKAALALAVAVWLGGGPGVALSADESPAYTVVRTKAAPEALLRADERAWDGVAGVSWGPAWCSTRFRALWNDEALLIRFDATDPDPWSTMTRQDEHLWEEEVVEIFLDLDRSGRDYHELEISPANVVCDVRMIAPSPDKRNDLGWNHEGLVTRTRINKDAAGKTLGWTATASLPWAGFRSLPSARAISLPPKPGDRWRFNLFRIERPGGKDAPQKDAVTVAWSPTGEPSFHVPRAFRDFVFAGER
jgi:hypothetical protein